MDIPAAFFVHTLFTPVTTPSESCNRGLSVSALTLELLKTPSLEQWSLWVFLRGVNSEEWACV